MSSPSLYYNHLPLQLQLELEAARRVGFTPVEIPGPAFDSLAAEGARMIYIVAGGRLLASKRQVGGENISHAALAMDKPVQSAGEFEVATEDGKIVVSALNNMSGHYCPGASSLRVARHAFEAAGIRIRSGADRRYDFEAP